MENQAPIIDLPAGEEDTEELAKNMTDEEARALLILTFRYTKEIVAFTRTLQQMLDGMMQNPMPAMAMMQQMQGGGSQLERLRASGLIAP